MTTSSAATAAPSTRDLPAFLQGLWYIAASSRSLKPGQKLALRVLDVPLLVGRDQQGSPFALLNACRHQGMPLSCGKFDGTHIECLNHGWRYDTSGQLAAIPALVSGTRHDLASIRLRRYPCRDVQGNLWVFMGDEEAALPPVPEVPGIGDLRPAISETMTFRCDADRAALGLIDPAHGPCVHQSWFWRSSSQRREKSRTFHPSHLGYTMGRHKPTSNTRALKLLSGVRDVEIQFQLPGIHIEHITIGKYAVGGLISITPVTAMETKISYSIYWTIPWLRAAAPILKLFTHSFFDQDRRAMDTMAVVQGLKNDFTLVGDPDMQATWYYRLKKEFVQARADGREFRNPLRETTLSWNT